MKDDPSISGKKTVEESVVESSKKWVDGVFQDGLSNLRGSFNVTLLIMAVKEKDCKMAEALIKLGAEVKKKIKLPDGRELNAIQRIGKEGIGSEMWNLLTSEAENQRQVIESGAPKSVVTKPFSEVPGKANTGRIK